MHTPGPWILERAIGTNDKDCGWDVLGQSASAEYTYRGLVCHATDAEHIGGITKAERDANVSLIAAAPDLLAALQSARYSVNVVRACLLDSVETHGTHGGWLHEEALRLAEVVDEIDAVIAKATLYTVEDEQ
jgi:hypothetical protein